MCFHIYACIKQNIPISFHSSDQTPEAPCPSTDQLTVDVSPSSERRPGSNAKAILPPIPTGRKTPAPPSPAPSPGPCPNPAGEGGDADREG